MQKTPESKNEWLENEYRTHIKNALGRGAVFQIITGIFFFILGSLVRIIYMDVLYWPPFLIFTLEYYFFWRLFGGMIIAIGIITFSYSRYYQNHYMRTQETKMAQALAICQMLFFPIGTIFGTMALKAINNQGISFDNGLKEMGIAGDYRPFLRKETGKLLVASALFHEAVLMAIFIITIYFSTVMLDITYPYLIIDTIYLIRYILLGLSIFFMGELLFGVKYEKICIKPQYQKIGMVIAIFQILFIPIGTYTGRSLLKSLKIENETNS